MDLRGKNVLITGAASGIGLCTAKEFAERQAIPVLIDVNADGLAEEVAELTAARRPACVQGTVQFQGK
jgi:NAD(P)-dependent dehydrogenase (short-subunit alcohol dehydrogenase family)